MQTTLDRYNKLCDMELIQKAKYDINARVELIIQEVQAFVKNCEDEARAMYFGDEKNLKKVSETP